MRKRSVALLTGLFALVVAVSFALAQPTTTDAAQGTQAQIELIVGLGVAPNGTPATPASIVSNIGSSGQDGVRVSDFSVDSFFDITYDATGAKIETEMVAMSLTGTIPDTSNPGVALDAVRSAVAKSGGTTHYGHVTVLK